MKIEVNPRVLLWARKEAGYEIEDIAGKLDIEQERYNAWEETGKDIPFGMLKKIAHQYKRQLAVFFLSTPPPKIEKPKDYRNLAVHQRGLSPGTLLAIRRTHKYIELAKNVRGQDYWDNNYSWAEEIMSLIEKEGSMLTDAIIHWLRNKLKIDIETQQRFKGYEDAFKQWRKCIENELGIFIFHFPMPDKELDGFSYSKGSSPFAIVINSNVFPQRKIFTLFHELAHILKHQSGICLPDIVSEKKDDEFECNKFAGKFLIPDKYVYPTNNIEDLAVFAKKIRVSRDVYLRRIFERKLITDSDFFTLLKELKEQASPPKEKKGGPVKPTTKSKSTRGEKFYNLVLNAAYENKINYTTASDVLGLGINYITK